MFFPIIYHLSTKGVYAFDADGSIHTSDFMYTDALDLVDLSEGSLVLIVMGAVTTRQQDALINYVKKETITKLSVYIDDCPCSIVELDFIRRVRDTFNINEVCVFSGERGLNDSEFDINFFVLQDITWARKSQYALENYNVDLSKVPSKKFSCLSSICRPHKTIISAHMLNKDSYTSAVTIDDAPKSVEFAKSLSNEIILNEVNHLLSVKSKNKKAFTFDNGAWDEESTISLVADSVIGIIPETLFFTDCAYFTEKTMKSFLAKRPFVLVSSPGTLQTLKEMGFKTFDRWWDESYDSEKDHTKRMDIILDLVDKLDEMSKEEMILLLDDMREVLEHNAKLLPNIKEGYLKLA
jgi:hypothetical protein